QQSGETTTTVVQTTNRRQSKTKVRGSRVLYKSKPLTVQAVKTVINGLLAEEGITAPEDTTFAAGRRSSDPHYNGKSGDVIRAGEPIVFDIFPTEPDGYWHDCTRTYAFSSPQRRVKEMYDAVLEAQTSALDMVREQASCSEMMIQVCKLFEKKGYPTPRLLAQGNKEARVRGFMHGLGHGVGLTIGERPYLSLLGKERLRKNSVVTIEPGLYDPRVSGV